MVSAGLALPLLFLLCVHIRKQFGIWKRFGSLENVFAKHCERNVVNLLALCDQLQIRPFQTPSVALKAWSGQSRVWLPSVGHPESSRVVSISKNFVSLRGPPTGPDFCSSVNFQLLIGGPVKVWDNFSRLPLWTAMFCFLLVGAEDTLFYTFLNICRGHRTLRKVRDFCCSTCAENELHS